MAVIRTKFTEEQISRRRAAQHGAKGDAHSKPLVKIAGLIGVVSLIYAVVLPLLWMDFSKFIGTKSLPVPDVPQLHETEHQLITGRILRAFLQKATAKIAVSDFMRYLAGAYDDTELSPGSPVPTVKPPVALVDSKGKLVTLVSVRVSAVRELYLNAVLLYEPKGPDPAMPGTPRELKLSKVHANGKPLSPGAVRRTNRLIHMLHRQAEEFLFRTQARAALNTEKDLVIKYADGAFYFNGYQSGAPSVQ